jgi:hypothetical protein
MSCTAVYKLYNTKTTQLGEDLSNGHGSGPSVWELASQLALGKKFSMWASSSEEQREHWNAWTSPKVKDYQKLVILSSYDRAYVGKENLKEYGEACIQTHKDILDITSWDWSHWESIGKLALELSKKKDKRLKGLCISCTSVDDPWGWADVRNIDTWEIYKHLDEFKKIKDLS